MCLPPLMEPPLLMLHKLVGIGAILSLRWFDVFCSVLSCVAVYCSVLQCVAVCCSVLQYDAVCYSVGWARSCPSAGLPCSVAWCIVVLRVSVRCRVLQCVAVCSCYSVLQCVAA